ncbi:MAG: hypothetical protein ACRD24_15385, partial [Terriglobales bacterium]
TEVEEAAMELQAAFYNAAPGLIGQADAARAQSLRVFEAQEAERLSILEDGRQQGIVSEQDYHHQVLLLDTQAQTRRIALAQQYPTFLQQQLRDLVASNVFSLSQITTSFTSATAQWIVTGQNFAAFWQSLQITIVQAFLNSLVQMFANWVLHTTVMEGAAKAYEIAKTAIFGTGEAARTATAVVTAKAMGVIMLGQLTAVSALAVGMITLMGAVTGTVVAMMGAIASALIAGVFTAALAVPVAKAAIELAIAGGAAVTAGTIAVGILTTAAGAAITAGLAVPALAAGGIVTSPLLAMVGEAGPEAVVPLDRMDSMEQTQQTIILMMDSRVIARKMVRGMPREVRLETGFAT